MGSEYRYIFASQWCRRDWEGGEGGEEVGGEVVARFCGRTLDGLVGWFWWWVVEGGCSSGFEVRGEFGRNKIQRWLWLIVLNGDRRWGNVEEEEGNGKTGLHVEVGPRAERRSVVSAIAMMNSMKLGEGSWS